MVSNVYGYYSISPEEGIYDVQFSYVGYASVYKQIVLDKDIRQAVALSLSGTELETVVIQSERIDQNVASVQMSTSRMDIKTIEKMPAFFGEGRGTEKGRII